MNATDVLALASALALTVAAAAFVAFRISAWIATALAQRGIAPCQN